MNGPVETRVMPMGKEAIGEAVRLLRAGEPVAMPTETVYGLAADATNAKAVARIYAAKGRPSFNPLIVHVADLECAQELGCFSEDAQSLASAHWPGPLTLVVPIRQNSPIASLVTAGLATVAIRVPAHPAMQALLKTFGKPVAAPSANASGFISPTRASHVLSSLGGRIPLIVDAGPTQRGIESTIVAIIDGERRLLRRGPIDVEATEVCNPSTIQAPGQLASHYAPKKPLRLDATSAAPGEYFIGFGALAGDETLSAAGDPIEAAARLFDVLHCADAAPQPKIAVAPVPGEGIARAIRDRLIRAAAPR